MNPMKNEFLRDLAWNVVSSVRPKMNSAQECTAKPLQPGKPLIFSR